MLRDFRIQLASFVCCTDDCTMYVRFDVCALFLTSFGCHFGRPKLKCKTSKRSSIFPSSLLIFIRSFHFIPFHFVSLYSNYVYLPEITNGSFKWTNDAIEAIAAANSGNNAQRVHRASQHVSHWSFLEPRFRFSEWKWEENVIMHCFGDSFCVILDKCRRLSLLLSWFLRFANCKSVESYQYYSVAVSRAKTWWITGHASSQYGEPCDWLSRRAFRRSIAAKINNNNSNVRHLLLTISHSSIVSMLFDAVRHICTWIWPYEDNIFKVVSSGNLFNDKSEA